jgi:hypothetical protein
MVTGDEGQQALIAQAAPASDERVLVAANRSIVQSTPSSPTATLAHLRDHFQIDFS